MAEFIESAWSELGKPCSERAIDLALTYAQTRGAAFDPEKSVLAHGDAHAWNTLLAPGEGPRWEWGFLERVANSLQLKREDLNDLAEASIAVSDALAEVTPARAARTR